MGDILMTTPAARALRKTLPKAFISYLVEEPFRDLVEGSPLFDEVLVLPKDISHASFLRYLWGIRKKKYDAVLDFHGGPRASLITLMSGAKTKVGYHVKHKSFIYDIRIPRSPEHGYIHSVENHLNLVRALGIKADSSSLEMPSAVEKEATRLTRFFAENGLDQAKMIVLHIGAGNEFRQWGVYNFSRFIHLAAQKNHFKVVLVGSEEDKTLEEDIQKASKGISVSLVGMLNLRELRWVISHAQLFVGSDSGPMHVAATTSTPIVALFGPTVPANFSPWNARSVLIEKNLDCRPCKQRECIHGDFRCIQEIHPQEVLDAGLSLLEER